ncbi:BRO family protein [Candidatus Liberibacter solanacearum]|uniref:BRO family protein n=1 Tax=Candidatus Liberibacter solanacearum TaxID=556287 RepID=UPI000A8136A5|nr:BRO family protein [Candidatus Liberibacter solanacearum]
MNSIIPFEFESNKIRTVVDKDGTIRFVAKDVAGALDYGRPRRCCKRIIVMTR